MNKQLKFFIIEQNKYNILFLKNDIVDSLKTISTSSHWAYLNPYKITEENFSKEIFKNLRKD